MSVAIDKQLAKKILLNAFKKPKKLTDKIAHAIEKILTGSHKTYKYVLVNGLLAKATNEKVNALALQAGADFSGSYDARSLCHSVLVPFERDFLQNAIGGSNEPFLNKPARFAYLSPENAVRGGDDRAALLLTIWVLKNIKSSSSAMRYLSCCLSVISERMTDLDALHHIQSKYDPTNIEIYGFVLRFLEKSLSGATCAITVATLEKLFYQSYKEQAKVVAHKLNQSGASSKEVSDIDVYSNNEFIYGIEIKDKNFTGYDVQHALEKIAKVGASKAQFIFGPRATFNESEILGVNQHYEEKGMLILFENIFRYARHVLFRIKLGNRGQFLSNLMETAIEINSTDETMEWIKSVMKDLGWSDEV